MLGINYVSGIVSFCSVLSPTMGRSHLSQGPFSAFSFLYQSNGIWFKYLLNRAGTGTLKAPAGDQNKLSTPSRAGSTSELQVWGQSLSKHCRIPGIWGKILFRREIITMGWSPPSLQCRFWRRAAVTNTAPKSQHHPAPVAFKAQTTSFSALLTLAVFSQFPGNALPASPTHLDLELKWAPFISC